MAYLHAIVYSDRGFAGFLESTILSSTSSEELADSRHNVANFRQDNALCSYITYE